MYFAGNTPGKVVLRDGFDTTGYTPGAYTFWARNGATGTKQVRSFTLNAANTTTSSTTPACNNTF